MSFRNQKSKWLLAETRVLRRKLVTHHLVFILNLQIRSGMFLRIFFFFKYTKHS